MATERLAVPEEATGSRLDQFLAVPVGSRSKAQSLIEARLVRVDGAPRSKRHLVKPGEVVELLHDESAPSADTSPSDVPFTIAYEDEHLLVVDKPEGVVVHPARGH